jgi:membrane-bound lytic murein transglycosylase D
MEERLYRITSGMTSTNPARSLPAAAHPYRLILISGLVCLTLLSGCQSVPVREPAQAIPPLIITPKAALSEEPLQEIPPLAQQALHINPTFINALPDLYDRLRVGYQIPTVDNPAIDERVEYFLTYPSFIDQSFIHSERYLYYVVQEIESRHLPMELALLPVIESAYNPYAYSRARAAGMWQFIAPTARQYAVTVDWWQDGRRDIIVSTRAALDYLTNLYNQFNQDWLLAVAAYNCGENAVQRAIDRNRALGLPTDFWHLSLPRETRGYVPSLLAMARIVANPAQYGLAFTPIANAPYFASIAVNRPLNLRVAAQLLGLPKNELHALNPAFNRWATPPNAKFNLLVPAQSKAAFEEALANMSSEELMPLEHVTLQKHQTLQSLAKARGIPVEVLTQLNPAPLAPGASVVLPAGELTPLRPDIVIENEHQAGKRPYAARRYVIVTDPKTTRRMANLAHQSTHRGRVQPAPTKNPQTAGHPVSHAGGRSVVLTVRPGEGLAALAKRAGISLKTLESYNSLGEADLRAGKSLKIQTGP